MGKHFFDYEDGDFAHSFSNNMAMDIDSGEIHIISSWSNDEDDDHNNGDREIFDRCV